MKARLLNRLPLIVICVLAVSVIATPLLLSLRGRTDSAEKACRKTEGTFSEFAVAQDIELDYLPLAVVINDKTDAVIVGGNSSALDFFDLTDGNQFLPPLNTNYSGFHSLALSEDADLLVGGTADGAVVVWQKDSGSETGWEQSGTKLPGGSLGGYVSAIAINRDGTLISASGNGNVFVWHKDKGADEWTSERQELSAHLSNDVLDVAFDSKNNLLSAGNDSRIRVWEPGGNSESSVVYSAKDNVDSIALNTTTGAIYAGLKDGDVEIWDSESQQSSETASSESSRLHSLAVKSLAMSTGKNLLVSGSNDKKVQVWNTCSQETLQTLTEHEDRVNSVDISKAGDAIASTGIDKRLVIRSR